MILSNMPTHIKFCMKFDKTAAEIFDMLHQAFYDYSLGQIQVFEEHASSKMVKHQSKMMSIQDDQPSAKYQKTWIHPWEPSANNPSALSNGRNQLRSLPGNLHRKREGLIQKLSSLTLYNVLENLINAYYPKESYDV